MLKFLKKKQKIAVLSVSAGSGHVRAAEAIKATADRYCPQMEVVHIDVMDLVPELFRKIYTETYLKIVEHHPAFWGYLYHKSDSTNVNSALSKLRIAIERLNTGKLRKMLKEINPDQVICTHFLPAQLLSRQIFEGKFDKPVWVMVTDFDLHGLWVQPNMTGYFAANEEVAWKMARKGIRQEDVWVTGIPIMPEFGEEQDREACRRELGLDDERASLLLMSGGAGMGNIAALAEQLIKANEKYQIVAIAGKNEELLNALNTLKQKFEEQIITVGYTDQIHRYMAACDMAITKPGGLTTSECLAMGLPMVLVSPIPGQEERNADYLLENGAAMKACDPDAVIWRVDMLLYNRNHLNALRENALKLARPEAATKILEAVALSTLRQSRH
ncbi:MAG TPA: glycosyltransferase [Deltaproteobacteria bacterium]|nr:glycosyltransferase [Deltaproteobacteria bacterium]HQB39994.1 glycosyltransferase [Deltaproteobacteria bacterium]